MSVNTQTFRKNKNKTYCQDTTRSKSSQKQSQKAVVSQQKAQKLFSIIQNFHNNLCTLPLNMLLSNNEPQKWLNQQSQTLRQLNQKLSSHSSNPQIEYYRAKIHSVSLILKNIKENIEALANIRDNLLYGSNKSSCLNSCLNSSRISKQTDPKYATIQTKDKQNPFVREQYEIKPNPSNIKLVTEESQVSKPEYMIHTSKTVEQNNDVYETELSRYRRQLQSLKTKRIQTINDENTNTLNKEPNTLNKLSKQPSERYLQTERQSTVCGHEQERQVIKSLTNRLKQAQEQMEQLQQQLIQKNLNIEKLLLDNNEMNVTLQHYKQQHKNQEQKLRFYEERINIIQGSYKQKLQQLHQYETRDQDYRQIILHEQQQKKQLQEQTNINEWQLNNHKEEMAEVKVELQQLKSQVKQVKRNQRVMQQKMNIYKHKYFQLVHELQRNNYHQPHNSTGKYAQIQQLINKHRNQLLQ